MSDLPHVLLIDDDPAMHKAVEFLLRGVAEVTACLGPEQALLQIKRRQFDAALVDVALGEAISGTQLVSSIHEADPDLASIVLTAHANFDTALEALRAHSFDFIPKTLTHDPQFGEKIQHAVVRTREQRARSIGVQDASRLRVALASAVVTNELEVTNGDIQRGLLAESLDSFSSILGRVELMDLMLKKRARTGVAPELLSVSSETVTELQDYVGKLRDYFAEPERVANSVNEVLGKAVGVVTEYAAVLSGHRIERGELRPDIDFKGDGRALLRAVVILLRLVIKSAPKKAIVSVRPVIVQNPRAMIAGLRRSYYARVLSTANFRAGEARAIAIEISWPGGGLGPSEVEKLFTTMDFPRAGGASPWSALAMVERLNGALVVEALGGHLKYWVLTGI
jgi:FixJ family two-component response regulator